METGNKYLVINVMQTELKKPGCNAFHLYDDTYIYITKLSGQSSLKYLITENKDLLALFMFMQKIIQNHCSLKVIKSKTRCKMILCLLFSKATPAIPSFPYAKSNLFRAKCFVKPETLPPTKSALTYHIVFKHIFR